MIEELSALLIKRKLLSNDKTINDAKNTWLEIYNIATQEKSSFLMVDLMKQDINEVFKIRFDKKIIVEKYDE